MNFLLKISFIFQEYSKNAQDLLRLLTGRDFHHKVKKISLKVRKLQQSFVFYLSQLFLAQDFCHICLDENISAFLCKPFLRHLDLQKLLYQEVCKRAQLPALFFLKMKFYFLNAQSDFFVMP